MSRRRGKPPEVFIKIERDWVLVYGPRAREVLDRAAIQFRPSRRGVAPRGWVIPLAKLPDLQSWCQWQSMPIGGKKQSVQRVPVEPVFVAPEPEPEPEPDPYSQGGLFGDAS